MKKSLILFLMLWSSIFMYAQHLSITGKVTDKQDEPIIGASVLVKGTSNGVITDLNGVFNMKNVPSDGVLTVSYIGYKDVEVKINPSQTSYSITLEEDNQMLDEVVVVGFGTQRRANLTEAVATVDTKSLKSRPVTNLGQSLQGTVPGLNLSVGSYGGQLGQAMDVNIRGTGTISTGSTASTLVLIDGIEGNMNNLNPDDIESISVLKDAAASSIYGSRAAFGVILITTKKGKAGKASVSYSGNARYYGPFNLPNLMNSWDFANYFNEASVNGGGNAIFDEDTMNRIQQYMRGEITTTTIANSNGNWQFHEKANDNVDWYDKHYKWSWAHEHNLNINGGSEKMQYYVSANYLGQDGNLRFGEDSYERINTNAKINAQPFKWLDVEVNVKYVHTDLDNPLYTDMGGLLYHDIVRMWPMMPFQDPNGHYMRNGKLAQLTSGSRSVTSNDNVYLQGQLVFHPLKGWNIYANAGLRTINEFRKQNLNKVYEYNVNDEPLLLGYNDSYAAGQTGAMQRWTRANHLTTSLYSDYEFTLNENHKFKVMAGMNTEKYNNRVIGVERMDLITENVPEIGAATGDDVINDASAYSWATVGFFGRFNYDYADKYFVAANVRYDGSSRFLRKDRWGTFGSFSLGWNVAREEFFPLDEDLMSQFKPRLSWGTLGNQNTNSYYPMYLTQSVSVNGGNWLMDGAYPTIAGVPGTISSTLTWETVQSLNVGFDMSMFRSRLSLNFDYFIRKTLDMVGPASEVAHIYGTGMPSTNNTDLKTKGWELAVNWRDRVGEVNYNVGFNIADSRSFVMTYPNESKSLGTRYEGEELNDIWGYVTHGIAKSQAEMDEWLKDNRPSWGSGWTEGDIMYTDLNGDGIINTGANTLSDPGDRVKLGNSTPRFRFGLNMGLDWKGIDFSMFWQGVAKRDLWLDGPLFWGVGSGEWQSTGLEPHLDYYRPENTTSVFGPNTDAYFPRIYLGNTKNQYTQSRYMQNGAYMRLKNIQVGYTLPKQVLDKIGMEYLRFYVSAENVLTISSLPNGFDPETAYSAYTGSNSGKTYPLQATVSFGVNVTF
ncbi:SusC/RagA family TonB-linked outer membrane protein [uncultured Mediterranea sp.]|uniref:SusC/RagA family TonB-linked outer membrane protein n=1 Tax=uncultured Mediterranea sp. TaxID=1926662 RepID=UPI0027D95E68|nr:SusC/RagA family TonB-linked outer membrane protein [uncultured Mediterranea sp.]